MSWPNSLHRPFQSWPPNNPHPLDWLYLSLLSTCSWCVVSALAPLYCGCHRIIQVDAAHWWCLRRDPPPPPPPPHLIVKHFGCTAIHNKVLYKCIFHHVLICYLWSGLFWSEINILFWSSLVCYEIKFQFLSGLTCLFWSGVNIWSGLVCFGLFLK